MIVNQQMLILQLQQLKVKNIFWILGGRKKIGGLSGIEKKLANILKSFTFGESGEDFKDFLEKYGINSTYNINLEKIIDEAIQTALQEKEKINMIFFPMRIVI